ncbi:nucleolar protein 8 isoform X2 [Ambystoma mexicanum]|uniref:nucleolar protein 8 isoform X2 n=1 Tax=Ambystoma mexicanum TaxID=8296 RepID=UPI0037E8F21E
MMEADTRWLGFSGMSLLNKTKWRGGTLQIELAKESFLHRLAQERQEANEKNETPKRDIKANLVKSMKKAGVENFQMRAVPGTEVPDHKNWVVSKFGRVLPVLHLQHRNKIMKYDPSKYCHNIKKLDGYSDPVSISQLTWHLEEGNDDISRKRRGEFPTTKKQLKKRKETQNSMGKEASVNTSLPQSSTCVPITHKTSDSLVGLSYAQANTSLGLKNVPSSGARSTILDINLDSDEEIKAPMVKQIQSKGSSSMTTEDLNVEVVKEDFVLKYSTHWAHGDLEKMKENTKDKLGVQVTGSGSDYDSADTDEIIAVAKPKMQIALGKSQQDIKRSSGSAKIDLLPPSSKSENNSVPKNTSKDTGCLMPRSTLLEGFSKGCSESDILSLSSATGQNSSDTDETIAIIKPLENRPANDLEQDITSVKSCKVKTQTKLLKSNANSTNRNALPPPPIPGNITLPGKTVKSMTCLESELSESSHASGSESDCQTSSETEGDPEYQEIMQNCHRIDLTFDDLERLASVAPELSSDESVESASEDSIQHDYNTSIEQSSQSTLKAVVRTPLAKKPILPEDIVSSILEEESSDEEHKTKRQMPRPKLPTFPGLGSLTSGEIVEHRTPEMSLISNSVPSGSEQVKAASSLHPHSNSSTLSPAIGQFRIKQNTFCSKSGTECQGTKRTPFKGTLSLSCLSENERGNDEKQAKSDSAENINFTSTSESSTDEDSSSPGDPSPSTQKSMSCQRKSPELCEVSGINGSSFEMSTLNIGEGKNLCPSLDQKTGLPCPAMRKQLMDNAKRLAAVQERQKELDLQKKCIKGALSNLDSQTPSKSHHIVFDSNSEDEVEKEDDSVVGEIDRSDPLQTKEAPSKRSSRLFESSDEEDAEEDGQRFSIKSQFEGKAGEKLMHLQSRFGTDERFRMDSRFLGSNSEEENADDNVPEDVMEEVDLVMEKKKNLEILQGLLNVNINSKASRRTKKAMMFRDINTLHYDPTREDHAVFERKVESVEKESKAKRKKIREEAEKLPEVSKEIYHEVDVDFKTVFGSAKPVPEENEALTPWDQKEEEQDKKELTDAKSPDAQPNVNVSVGCGGQNPAVFTFSFLGDDEEAIVQEEPYKMEVIKPTKLAWQQDKRFQDSSDEDEKEEDQTVPQNVDTKVSAHPKKVACRFFFFTRDDERLKAGPTMFWRSSSLDLDKDTWEERRAFLLEECRKRHKDAKRRIKVKQ